MSNVNSPNSPALEEAIRLVQAGKPMAAEERMRRFVRAAREKHGPDSLPFAQAANELGLLLMALEQSREALDAFREASQAKLPPGDAKAVREQLTFQMNLGTALEQTAQYEEAERVLRGNLEARRKFYGRAHPGYAFGLLPLAEVIWRQGRAEEALLLADEAASNLEANGHPEYPRAVAVRVEIAAASGLAEPFATLSDPPDEILQAVGGEVLRRLSQAEPPLARRLAGSLLPLASGRFGDAHPLSLNLLTWIANLERDLGSPDGTARFDAIRRVIAAYEQLGERRGALQAQMGLAMALGDCGKPDEAAAVYEEAHRRAQALNDVAAQAQVLRNFGLLLSELGRKPEAEQRLRGAVLAAEASGNDEMAGRCGVALGIFFQHAGRRDEAKPLLAQALQRLDPAHPDAVSGRGHLRALESGDSCGCGDTREALQEAFRAYVLKQMPAGLVEDLQVELTDDDFKLGVETSRQPTPEEAEQIERVIRHAVQHFRDRARNPAS